MKALPTLAVLGFALALQTAAAQSTNVLASATSTSEKVQPLTTTQAKQAKVEPPKAPSADRSQILRLDGMSSQAWTTIATRKPGGTGFHDAKDHEPVMGLCVVGRKP